MSLGARALLKPEARACVSPRMVLSHLPSTLCDKKENKSDERCNKKNTKTDLQGMLMFYREDACAMMLA